MDEAVHYGYGDCVSRVWNQVGVIFDEATPELILQRPYGRVDRKRMKMRLIQECKANGVRFQVAKVTHIDHTKNQPSIVTLLSTEDNGKTPQQTRWKALFVVADATGFARQFVKHDTAFDPGYQVTYGARFCVKDLGPYTQERMVLMDYSEGHLHDDATLKASNDRFPSFVYAMPLAEDELILEETILVSRPGGSSRDLQARLEKLPRPAWYIRHLAIW
jgi:lycopene cyclase-like protein